jgi:hypothetical protein
MTKPIFKETDTLIDIFKKLSRRKKGEYVFRPRDGFICWLELYEKGYNNLYKVWQFCYWDINKTTFGEQSQYTQQILNDINN